MLCITRRENERILIGDHIIVTVVETKGKQVKLGIQAPADVRILREELTREGGTDANQNS